jgi:hypothetical protein
MLIGLGYKKQVGKDTAAEMIQQILTEEYVLHVENVKFADKLKDILCLLTGCTRCQLEDDEFKNGLMSFKWAQWIKNEKATNEYNVKGVDIVRYQILTYREALQKIGTELFRNQFHPDTWVNATMNDYMSDKIWTISDVRFSNEVKAIKDKGGIVINIVRDTGFEDNHESETALDNYKYFDYIVENNGTKEELREKLRHIIEEQWNKQ